MLRKPKVGNRKFFYGLLLICFLFFGTVAILPEPVQDKVKDVFFGDIPFRIYHVVAKPVLSSCFFQESKLSALLDISKFGRPINPNCFIDEEKLKAKIQAGLPLWARKQIEEDLKKFSNITKNDLNQYETENRKLSNMIARFQIQNKKVVYKTDSHVPRVYYHPRDVMEFVLAYLAEHEYIRDTDFILALSDFFLPAGKKPVPIFTFAKDLNIPIERDQILIPDWQNLGSVVGMRKKIAKAKLLHPWNTKKNRLFWRGGRVNTSKFREEFVSFSKLHPDLIDAEFLSTYGTVDNKKFIPPEDHLKYKYLISIDGYRASWERLVWHLYSNSLVFKEKSSQVQWFYKGIKPYVHYVPVTNQNSILGGIQWAEENPERVQSIIHDAEKFVENNLSLEDMYHYIIVLLEEYNKKRTS